MKRITVVCIVILVLFAIFMAYVIFGVNSSFSRSISYYQALSGETEGKTALWLFPWGDYVHCPYDLPRLEELGDYEDLRFVHNAKRVSIFSNHGYVLVAEYDAEEYAVQKQAMDQRYTWCTRDTQDFDEGVMPEGTFYLDDFSLRAVEGGDYPHEMLFIGCSDSRQEIAVIFIYDQDLDTVDEPWGEFIGNNTEWSQIVK